MKTFISTMCLLLSLTSICNAQNKFLGTWIASGSENWPLVIWKEGTLTMVHHKGMMPPQRGPAIVEKGHLTWNNKAIMISDDGKTLYYDNREYGKQQSYESSENHKMSKTDVLPFVGTWKSDGGRPMSIKVDKSGNIRVSYTQADPNLKVDSFQIKDLSNQAIDALYWYQGSGYLDIKTVHLYKKSADVLISQSWGNGSEVETVELIRMKTK